jgi:HPt (histidine-containing phosphotransfer) domain-containing protein
MDTTNRETARSPLLSLESYPYMNPDLALTHLNHNKELMLLMLQEFFIHEMPTEKPKFMEAYAQQDWDKIEKMAHKITGGIMYLGLTKLQYACQNLERYYQTGQTQLLSILYHQFIQVFEKTHDAIAQWLELEKNKSLG